MPRCFVIMPILTPGNLISSYGDDPDHFGHVLQYLFKPALERSGYDMVPPSVSNSQIIQAEIIRNLETADLVLCDISQWNANVFFELGIRVALDRPVVLVKDSKTPTIPFDNSLVSCHTYDASMAAWCLDTEIESLVRYIQSAGMQDRNALWRYFGITQRASASVVEDPVQEKLDLIIASLQRLVRGERVAAVESIAEQLFGRPPSDLDLEGTKGWLLFRDSMGTPVIPGSSLKGILRQHAFEAVQKIEKTDPPENLE